MHRRQFLGTAAFGGLAAALPVPVVAADTTGLPNLAAKAVPIGRDERMARIAKAKELMRANDIGALLIERDRASSISPGSNGGAASD